MSARWSSLWGCWASSRRAGRICRWIRSTRRSGLPSCWGMRERACWSRRRRCWIAWLLPMPARAPRWCGWMRMRRPLPRSPRALRCSRSTRTTPPMSSTPRAQPECRKGWWSRTRHVANLTLRALSGSIRVSGTAIARCCSRPSAFDAVDSRNLAAAAASAARCGLRRTDAAMPPTSQRIAVCSACGAHQLIAAVLDRLRSDASRRSDCVDWIIWPARRCPSRPRFQQRCLRRSVPR